MDGDLPAQGLTYLLTQGVLGFTTAAAAAVAIFLYRAREADRMRYEATMAAKDQAHDVEVAQWIKLNQDLRAEQLNDQRVQNERLNANTDLIRQLWQAKAQGGQLDRAI